jgi:hypothetical protein
VPFTGVPADQLYEAALPPEEPAFVSVTVALPLAFPQVELVADVESVIADGIVHVYVL